MLTIPLGGGEFWARFALASLATWRITHLLAAEDGPGDVLFKVRARLGQGFWGKLMDCSYCLSLWVAAPFTLFVRMEIEAMIPVWLALSGLACLLERATLPAVHLEPPTEQNNLQGETQDGLLWTEARSGSNTSTDGAGRFV